MSPEHGSSPGSRTCGFDKQARVRKRREFLQIQNTGRRVASRHFLIVYVCSGDGPPRLGITVTKKIGNAVTRNRIKRAVRETFRSNAATLRRGTSMVVIARDGAAALGVVATADELVPALRTLGAPAGIAPRGAGKSAPARR